MLLRGCSRSMLLIIKTWKAKWIKKTLLLKAPGKYFSKAWEKYKNNVWTNIQGREMHSEVSWRTCSYIFIQEKINDYLHKLFSQINKKTDNSIKKIHWKLEQIYQWRNPNSQTWRRCSTSLFTMEIKLKSRWNIHN